jgi:hypothetical protein
MSIYEHLYLITVSGQLAGQAYIDTVTVIFAIMVTGYFAGSRLNKTMLVTLIAISALFVVPMIGVVTDQLERIVSLSAAVPLDQADEMPFLVSFATTGAAEYIGSGFLAVPLFLAYIGAIAFVVHCQRRGTVTADNA